GPSNEGGVALPRSSSSMRARSSYKYAGAYSGAATTPLTSNLSPLTYGAAPGAGMHLTSTAEIKSFGGGGNGGSAMGGAMSNGRFNSGLSNPSLQGGAGVGISPIAYSTARRGGMSSVAGDDLAMMASENPVMAMTNAASVGMGNAVYSGMGYTTMGYYGSSSYGSPAGIRGRRNVGIEDNYYGWLRSDLWGYGGGYDGITMDVLRKLYADATGDTDFSNEEAWEAFLAWFNSQQDNELFGWYWAPISDAIPFLLLLCAIWALVVYRRTKSQTVPCEEVEK
ncbi:MAG: hypothetical protein IKW35_04880, partial [Paludibacteraceae bacterium]|nr:hypothetical protein [Paludibacteraceae bacterium]